MSSFAFYFDKENSSIKIDVHFNLWNQCGWNETFLDTGVMLYDVEKDCKLYIRFPFKFDREDVVSLDDALDSIDTLSVIFNESCTTSGKSQSKWISISNGSGKKFNIYKVDISDNGQLELSDVECDTLATITIPRPDNDSHDVYIRFRVKITQGTSIIRSYDRPYKFIRGIFQKSYIIDFRYNDKRSFSKNAIEKIEKHYNWANTQKIHFLLMSNASVNVECGGSVKKRMLEGNAWAKYLNVSTVSNDIIAYHATARIDDKKSEPMTENKGDSIESWEFFAKQYVEDINKFKFSIFMLVTISVGIFCSVVSNPIYSFICKLWDYIFRRCGT